MQLIRTEIFVRGCHIRARLELYSSMNDGHEPELSHLLDDPYAPPPSADVLRTIVTRGRRGRERALAGGLVLALVAGPLIGFLVGRSHNGSGSGQQLTAAAAPETPSVTPGVDPAAGVPGSGTGARMQALTARTTDEGIRLRLFLTPAPALTQPANGPQLEKPNNKAELPVYCRPSATLDVELSNDATIGRAVAPQWAQETPPNPLSLAGMSFTGLAEGSPVFTVIVRAAGEVKSVRLTLDSGGSDSMAPVQGWVALAHGLDPSVVGPPKDSNGKATKLELPAGHLDALDGTGKVIKTVALSDLAKMKVKPQLPADCTPPAPPKTPAPNPPGLKNPAIKTPATSVPPTTMTTPTTASSAARG